MLSLSRVQTSIQNIDVNEDAPKKLVIAKENKIKSSKQS